MWIGSAGKYGNSVFPSAKLFHLLNAWLYVSNVLGALEAKTVGWRWTVRSFNCGLVRLLASVHASAWKMSVTKMTV